MAGNWSSSNQVCKQKQATILYYVNNYDEQASMNDMYGFSYVYGQ